MMSQRSSRAEGAQRAYSLMPAPDPFLDPAKAPPDSALKKRIGDGYRMIEHDIKALQAAYPGIEHSWTFSKTSGWYVTFDKGRKRLCYLFPKKNDLLLRIVFNEKAVDAMRASDLPAAVAAQLRTAKVYPEGRLLEFTGATLQAGWLARLMAFKLAH